MEVECFDNVAFIFSIPLALFLKGCQLSKKDQGWHWRVRGEGELQPPCRGGLNRLSGWSSPPFRETNPALSGNKQQSQELDFIEILSKLRNT